jgi:hypothetical protein
VCGERHVRHRQLAATQPLMRSGRDWSVVRQNNNILYNCNVQGVARHWRNPVRTRVTLLDSSDALYIVFLAYTAKHMDNVVRFQHPCVLCKHLLLA